MIIPKKTVWPTIKFSAFEGASQGSRFTPVRSRSRERTGGKIVKEVLLITARNSLDWLIRAVFLEVLCLDTLVNLFPVNGNFFGRIDADSHLVPFHTKDRDSHVITG